VEIGFVAGDVCVQYYKMINNIVSDNIAVQNFSFEKYAQKVSLVY